MKNLFAKFKKTAPKKEGKGGHDIAVVIKRVDEQIGRAVTRLSER